MKRWRRGRDCQGLTGEYKVSKVLCSSKDLLGTTNTVCWNVDYEEESSYGETEIRKGSLSRVCGKKGLLEEKGLWTPRSSRLEGDLRVLE